MPKKIPSYKVGSYLKRDPYYPVLADIDDRLIELENKVFRTSRKTDTSIKQQILLLSHLGLLDKLNELNLSGVKKRELLSILLNANVDTIKDCLTELYKKDSMLKTKGNYEFLLKTFKDAGLENHAEEADKILDEILKQEK